MTELVGEFVVMDAQTWVTRQRDGLLDIALDNMPHGLCMFSADKKLILCNFSYAQMYDLPEDLTLAGTPLPAILDYRAGVGNGPLHAATYFDVVGLAAQKGGRASQDITLQDGRVVRITHSSMEDGRYVATHEDITESVRNAEALFKNKETLEATVALRTQEVEEQTRELERLLLQERNINELQRQFVALASHEFRTPLAIIDGAAQRLLRAKGEVSLQFVRDKAEQIRSSVLRIVDLMESILAASRMDNGTIQIRHERFPLRAMIESCCHRQSTITKSHRIISDIDSLPEYIEADKFALEQVFSNLLSNAAKYAPHQPDIYVSGWQEGEAVKIVVRDNGVGIDAEDVPKIFQRYFRARTSTGIPGTGLGLYLVKQIVDLHGGSIEIDSKKGKGTSLIITLPISKNASPISVDRTNVAQSSQG
ncbi:signal transduction histidine kinase [Rhizobium leucaenae]|uniref:histidine kinase n=2 Tax=Rhizobium leucaenae TaxID=29450 RepID=A0A7W7EKW6_9HYPH|nr:signal transduction histidine kinase [Rhizobium leucaenae]MBB6302777.1 signal transduction histidine kinase [Rhizobium leucaenae]